MEPRGFAFVRFVERRDAEEAMRALEGKEVDGREIHIEATCKVRLTEDTHLSAFRKPGREDRRTLVTTIAVNVTTIEEIVTTIGETATTIGETATTIGETVTTIGETATTIGGTATMIEGTVTTIGGTAIAPPVAALRGSGVEAEINWASLIKQRLSPPRQSQCKTV